MLRIRLSTNRFTVFRKMPRLISEPPLGRRAQDPTAAKTNYRIGKPMKCCVFHQGNRRNCFLVLPSLLHIFLCLASSFCVVIFPFLFFFHFLLVAKINPPRGGHAKAPLVHKNKRKITEIRKARDSREPDIYLEPKWLR